MDGRLSDKRVVHSNVQMVIYKWTLNLCNCRVGESSLMRGLPMVDYHAGIIIELIIVNS